MITIALFEPEKPSNVGNIIRTCKAFDLKLAIIGNLTFSLNDKDLKRAQMDYCIGFQVERYDSICAFLDKHKNDDIYYVTRYSKNVYSNFSYKDKNKDYVFMFGKESTGLPKELLKENINKTIRIPMAIDSRSLNLSNCVAIVASECLRQQDFNNLSTVESIKGMDFLENYKK